MLPVPWQRPLPLRLRSPLLHVVAALLLSLCARGSPSACPAGRFGPNFLQEFSVCDATTQLKSKADCEAAAAKILGLSSIVANDEGDTRYPVGCYIYAAANTLWFNTPPAGASGAACSALHQCVCGGGCADCPGGKYTASDGVHEKCDFCPQGQHMDGTASTGCKLCPGGRFADVVGMTLCKECSPGLYTPLAAQLNCGPCEHGRYSDQAGATTCIHCARGRFSARAMQSSAEACHECALNKHNDLLGATECKDCAIGYYTLYNASVHCTKNLSYVADGTPFPTPAPTQFPTPAPTPRGPVTCQPGTRRVTINGSDACTPCDSGTYTVSIDEATCAGTPCPVGRYGILGATSAAEAANSCKDCSSARFQDVAGQGACKGCSPGQHRKTSAPATSGAIVACTHCVPGKYSDVSGLKECKNCAAGEYGDQTGQIECKGEPCVPGKFFEQDGLLAPVTCKDCAAGQHTNVSGLTQCDGKPCATGKFFPHVAQNNSVTCFDCPAGKYQDSIAQQQCKGESCPPGKFGDAAQLAPKPCKICPNALYNDQTGQSVCKGCLQGKHRYKVAAPRSVEAIACEACERGRYNDQIGQAECKSCIAGQYQDQTQQETCKGNPCFPGTFSPHEAQPTPVPCEDCSPGQYQDVEGQRTCKGDPCVAGKYFEALGQIRVVTCKNCVLGEFQDIAGQQGCKRCVAGQYQDTLGQPDCKGVACAAGMYFNGEGQTAPVTCLGTACAPGKYGPSAQTTAITCTDCVPGQFQNDAGQTSCKGAACARGRYFEEIGRDVSPAPLCKSCPSGKYQDQMAQASCSKCPAGRFTSLTEQMGCVACPKWQYQGSAGATSCLECMAGKRRNFAESVASDESRACYPCDGGVCHCNASVLTGRTDGIVTNFDILANYTGCNTVDFLRIVQAGDIPDLTRLTSLRSISGRDAVGRSLDILGCEQLTSLSALSAPDALQGPLLGRIGISRNTILASLEGLEGLTAAGAGDDGYVLWIVDNVALSSVAGLRGLQGSLDGALFISGNKVLPKLAPPGLDGVWNWTGGVHVMMPGAGVLGSGDGNSGDAKCGAAKACSELDCVRDCGWMPKLPLPPPPAADGGQLLTPGAIAGIAMATLAIAGFTGWKIRVQNQLISSQSGRLVKRAGKATAKTRQIVPTKGRF